MGKITKVSSSIYNLLGKQEPVRCIRVITMQYLFDGTDRFTPMLIDSLLEGNGLRFRNYLKWAENSGYNDWLGISAPSFMQKVNIDPGTLTNTFKNIMENDPGFDIGEQTKTVPTTIKIRYPNPEYVIDPETGKYPPNIPQYLYKYITLDWQYRVYPQYYLYHWAFGRYTADTFAPFILEMCFKGTMNALDLTYQDVIDGDSTNYSIAQIKKSDGQWYLRFGDLTTYNNTEVESTMTDLADESLWDFIVGDVNINNLATSGSYYVGVIYNIQENWYKAIYESIEDPNEGTVYPVVDENSLPNILRWEEAVASSPEDPYEDWTHAEDHIWSDITHMGPTYTLESDWLNAYFVSYILEIPTQYPELNALLPEPVVIENDYWGSWFPLRDDNRAIEPNRYPEAWEWGKKVGKRLYDDSGKVAELIDQINQNPQVGDIDYAYLEVGIPLNVKQKYVCRYMMEFWKNMFDLVGASQGDENGEVFLDVEYTYSAHDYPMHWSYNYTNKPLSYIYSKGEYRDGSTGGWTTYSLYSEDEIEIWENNFGAERTAQGTGLKYQIRNGIVFNVRDNPNLQVTHGGDINIATNGTFNRHITISFGGIMHQTGLGLLDNNHDSGDCWADTATDTFYVLYYGDWNSIDNSLHYSGRIAGMTTVNVTWINYKRQIDTSNWEIIRVAYINQANIIKNGVGDYNYGVQEFNKVEEDYEFSGVLIPLSYNTMKSISLLDATDCVQFASSLRFNCYVVKKKKWYQSGFFGAIIKIAGIVISVVVMIVNPPAGSALATSIAGALGVTSAIGTAIIGAVANAVIAVVVSAVVTPVLKDLLGDFAGGILGVIAGIAITWGINSALSGGFSFESFTNEFMKIDNIMSLVKSIGNAYLEVIQGKMEDLQNEMNNFQNRYNEANEALASASESNLSGWGMNSYWQQLYYQNNALNSVIESRDRFLDRTLMLADDAISIQLSWIEDLAGMTIRNDPTTNIID